MFEPVHSLISPQNVVVLRAQVTPPSLTKDVVRSLHGKSRGQVTATRTAALVMVVLCCCVGTILAADTSGTFTFAWRGHTSGAKHTSPTRSDDAASGEPLVFARVVFDHLCARRVHTTIGAHTGHADANAGMGCPTASRGNLLRLHAPSLAVLSPLRGSP